MSKKKNRPELNKSPIKGIRPPLGSSAWAYEAAKRQAESDEYRRRYEQPYANAMQQRQSQMNQGMNRYQQGLQNQLTPPSRQRGSGMASISSYGTSSNSMNDPRVQQLLQQLGMNSSQRPTARPNSNNMAEPAKYELGAKVTVRRGATIWTIAKIEQHQNYSGSPIYLYFLEDERGKQTREEERDLNIIDVSIPKTKVDFDTVIISDEKREQILQAIEQINQSDLIFTKWGFGEVIEKGRGVSMLFYGPPGTGKTLMAQAIANKFGYTLKVIATADIESSAPGEAERNIRKYFKEAKDGKTILLFDECDSLIYNRQNTGPIMSAQVNELLSQIERFDGITLFTTNRLGTLDEAVNRRLALKLEFAMPSPKEREEIWKRMFPKQAPLHDDIDWALLADFEITGGYIKNAVLRAARMAATEDLPDDDKKISMAHLSKALRFEVTSMMEFEDARDEQQGKVGRVVMGNGGKKTIQRNTVGEGGI